MAVTRLIPLHINKGKSAAQCLTDRSDYVQDGRKTEEGKLIRSYCCDPRTADREFLLSKREYQHKTGRTHDQDILAYQIRQSFRPGEITPEAANEIGYELAMRFTKGRHAFFVATHTDRAHIHNHIIFNSTNLDCTGKFRDFRRSWQALSRLSDLLCLEKGLSVVKPEQKKKGTPYQKKYPKRNSRRDGIRADIDRAFVRKNPRNMEELFHVLEKEGYECRRGPDPAVRKKGEKTFLRFSSMGEGYTSEDLEGIFAGTRKYRAGKQRQKYNDTDRLQMLIDMESVIRKKKGAAYERWAKVFNLKQTAKVLNYLQENEIYDMEKLNRAVSESAGRYHELAEQIKKAEENMKEISSIRTHIFQYSKTKKVYQEYRRTGYSRKFFDEHRKEIQLHQAAKEAFSKIQGNIPKVKELNRQYGELLESKRRLYGEYRKERERMRELQTVQKVVEILTEKDDKKIEKGIR